MMNVSHVETAMTDQPEPASSKVDGRSWAEKARAFIGDGRQVVGIVLSGISLAGLALLLLTWTFGGSGGDPALVGSWHSRPLERHPLDVVMTPPPAYTLTLVLNRDGSYRRTYVVNSKMVVIDGTWSAGERHLTLQESWTFLGINLPGKSSRYEYRMTDFRPIDKSLGRGLELKNVVMTLEAYSLIDEAALQKALERIVRPR